MKGIGLFLIAAAMAFGAAGCNEDTEKITSNDPPNPDVVVPYSAPSNTATAIAFEEVTANLGLTPIFKGYIRNVSTIKKDLFEVKFKLTIGDLAVQDPTAATLTATVLEPGMRTKFEGTPAPAGHTQVTLTYWGLDGTKTTQMFVMEIN